MRVTCASVTTGMPMPPNGTGIVLPIRHALAASPGVKPTPTIIDAASAMGVPKPLAPSMKPLNVYASSSASSRLSCDTDTMENLTVLKCPVATLMSYVKMAARMIRQMGHAPCGVGS